MVITHLVIFKCWVCFDTFVKFILERHAVYIEFAAYDFYNIKEPRHGKMCLREFPTRSDSNWPAQL